MSGQAATAISLNLEQKSTRTWARTGFFFWVSVLMLASLLIGFAPTLYLRSFFDVEPIPGYLYLHGIVLTTWFVWLVVQTSLVRTGRTATHRRLGVTGAVIAAVACVAGPLATLGSVARVRAAGFDWDTDMSAASELGVEGVTMVQFMSQVVWGNLSSIVVFAAFVAVAILLRRNSQAHKRLMLLASIAIVGPALARISRIPILGGEDGPFIPLALLGLLLAVLVHDLVADRRLHKASWIGVGVIVLAAVGQQVVATSEFGLNVVRAMGEVQFLL